ncbi:TonB family protein [Synoicihabitans lomoniglobus]|uniref:TonB family protein n=1 Tax=Synoicihabitans lomoniglobus TaxID=2909285 RepID=A0AAE9ZW52_9BACT|nr:energy transducer TonB [Opitutaceae bacterium LMO-M01]WED65232.1 TonB family protein [Opitutaceae bacterium LMO-M01]
MIFGAMGLLAPVTQAADDDIVPPRLTRPVQPNYPSDLRDAGVEGQVDVRFEVDRYGMVKEPKVHYATHKEFGKAVEDVVTRWRFSPARKGGLPVDQRVRMPVVFVVKQDDPLSKWAGRNVFKKMEGQPLDADELGVWPEPTAWIEPYYPPQLNGTGKRGEVVVSFVIDEHGDVVNPEILIGDDPHFIASALAATVSLEFSPHLNEAGEPVPVSMAVSYRFDEKKQQQWDRAVGSDGPKS